MLIRLCEEYRSPLHIVHLSAAGALPMLRDAKARGLPVSAETCPHYLFFSAEEIADGDTRFKCAPPIRGRLNCEQLWEGLADGTIDLIASDHSPCPPDLKQLDSGDFDATWGGVASLQLGLPAMWTAARARGHSLVDLARWMAEGPARLAGLPSKGSIVLGADADLVVFDPDREVDTGFDVRPELLHHRHPVTPYTGRALVGVVEQTYLRGRLIYDNGGSIDVRAGRWLRK